MNLTDTKTFKIIAASATVAVVFAGSGLPGMKSPQLTAQFFLFY